MVLPNVAKGDPHIAAHNAERHEINALSLGVEELPEKFAPYAGSSEYAGIGTVQPRESSVLFGAVEMHHIQGPRTSLQNSGSPAYILGWPMTGVSTDGLQLVGRSSIKPPSWATKVARVLVTWAPTVSSGTGVPRLRVLVGTHRVDGGGSAVGPALPVGGDLSPTLPSIAYRSITTDFGVGPAGWNVNPLVDRVFVHMGRNAGAGSETADAVEIHVQGIEVFWG